MQTFYRLGCKHPNVKLIKQKLVEDGYVPGRLNQKFETETQDAVKKFQANSEGLTVDGEVGPKTWAALFPGRPYQEPSPLDSKKFHITPNYFLSVATLITIGLFLIGTTYYLLNYFVISKDEKVIGDQSAKITALSADQERLERDNAVLRSSTGDNPILTSPRDNESLVGDEVTLKWHYKSHDANLQYVIELTNLSDPHDRNPHLIVLPVRGIEKWPLRIAEPSYENNSTYLWRVAPILSTSDGSPEALESNPHWSSSGRFSIYRSVIDRICVRKQLVIGDLPRVFGRFSYIGSGGMTGFEEDLKASLAKELTQELRQICSPPLPSQTVLTYTTFYQEDRKDLLNDLSRHRYDLVVASMTDTKEREQDFHVRFSKPYFTVHQILIAAPGAAFRSIRDLADRKLAVYRDTTNSEAAMFLKGRRSRAYPFSTYAFQIDESVEDPEQIYQALTSGEADLGLVDDASMDVHLEDNNVCVVPINLSKDLATFDRQVLGRDNEHYSIATADQKMLQLVNTILDGLDLDKMRAKWGLDFARMQKDETSHTCSSIFSK